MPNEDTSLLHLGIPCLRRLLLLTLLGACSLYTDQRLVFAAQRTTGFALMALDLQTDTVLWALRMPVLSQARPLIVGSRVFWGADRLYAIEAERGRFQTYEISGGPVGSPILSQNTLYVPGGRFMHVVDPHTGQVRERFEAEEWVQAPPTVGPPLMHQGVVYFSSLDCRVYAVRFGKTYR